MRCFSLKTIGMIAVFLWISIVGAPGVRAYSPIWAPPQLTELIEEGLVENNEIQSLEAQVESLKEEISFAGALDDPRLGFAILNLPTDSFDFDQEPMTQKQIFLAQKVPWFGKLDLKTQRATLKAVRQQAVLEAKHLELARKIATTFYELGFVGSSLKINARLTDIVTQLLGVTETRYATGRGLQQDVLQAQVELSKLLDEKITLDRRRRTLEDRVNGLLNRGSFTAVTPLYGIAYPDLQLDTGKLQSKALKENPELRIRQFDIDIAAVDIELSKKDYWPDMDFKVAYGQRGEDKSGRGLPDLVSGSVTMNVPLWFKKRQNSKLAARMKSREAAIRTYRNLAAGLPHEVDSLATQIRDTQKNYRLFTDALIIQADQWARSSQAAYEVGSIEFNTMIGAWIRLMRLELQAENYLYTIYQRRAELEAVLGGPM